MAHLNLLAALLVFAVVQLAWGGGCSPGSDSCSRKHRKRSKCVYWCDSKDCPRRFPIDDSNNWKYCWGLKCHFWCYGCNQGYRAYKGNCVGCAPGKSSKYAQALPCFQCEPGWYGKGADVCHQCDAGKYTDNYGKALCSPCLNYGSGIHWYSSTAGSDHCDRCEPGKCIISIRTHTNTHTHTHTHIPASGFFETNALTNAIIFG